MIALLFATVLLTPVPASRFPVPGSSDTVVTVFAGSGLDFEPAELALKQGTQVKLRFVNAGSLPHNFVLLLREADLDTLATAASKTGGDYVPLALKDKLLAWTKLASPGDTVEASFTVPPPGEYTFVCLMSGHAGVMLGKLRSVR